MKKEEGKKKEWRTQKGRGVGGGGAGVDLSKSPIGRYFNGGEKTNGTIQKTWGFYDV